MPVINEYKGNKLICLNPEEKFTFSFGLSKAKMILENIGSIEAFVATNGESCDVPSEPIGTDSKPPVSSGGEDLPF